MSAHGKQIGFMIRVINCLFEAFDQVGPDSKQNSIRRLLIAAAAVFNFVWFMLLSNIGFRFLALNNVG